MTVNKIPQLYDFTPTFSAFSIPIIGHSHPGTLTELFVAFQDTQQGSDALEYEFDLLEVGCTGTIEVIPESINKSSKKELKPLTTVSLLIFYEHSLFHLQTLPSLLYMYMIVDKSF